MQEKIKDDTISREAAIQTALEFIVEYLGGAFNEDFQKKLIERMDTLPPEQPEIIRCKDCIYGVLDPDGNLRCYRTGSDYDYTTMRYALGDDGFCSAAQRRI